MKILETIIFLTFTLSLILFPLVVYKNRKFHKSFRALAYSCNCRLFVARVLCLVLILFHMTYYAVFPKDTGIIISSLYAFFSIASRKNLQLLMLIRERNVAIALCAVAAIGISFIPGMLSVSVTIAFMLMAACCLPSQKTVGNKILKQETEMSKHNDAVKIIDKNLRPEEVHIPLEVPVNEEAMKDALVKSFEMIDYMVSMDKTLEDEDHVTFQRSTEDGESLRWLAISNELIRCLEEKNTPFLTRHDAYLWLLRHIYQGNVDVEMDGEKVAVFGFSSTFKDIAAAWNWKLSRTKHFICELEEQGALELIEIDNSVSILFGPKSQPYETI